MARIDIANTDDAVLIGLAVVRRNFSASMVDLVLFTGSDSQLTLGNVALYGKDVAAVDIDDNAGVAGV